MNGTTNNVGGPLARDGEGRKREVLSRPSTPRGRWANWLSPPGRNPGVVIPHGGSIPPGPTRKEIGLELTEGWSTIKHASNVPAKEKLHWFMAIKGTDDTQQTVCGNYLVPGLQSTYFMDIAKCWHCLKVLKSRS